jgi:hypothetical protein
LGVFQTLQMPSVVSLCINFNTFTLYVACQEKSNPIKSYLKILFKAYKNRV